MIQYAKIHWLDSGEPFSEQFQDFYFSTEGGLQETEYVFLTQNNFPQVLKSRFHQKIFKIAETGFGTGLNFLATAMHYLQTSNIDDSTLEYTSIEKYPLNRSDLIKIFSIFKCNWPQLSTYCDELLAHYPIELEKENRFQLFDGKIILNLLINDANTALNNLYNIFIHTKSSKIDAWYLDGFSPAKNPDMWNQDLFSTIAKLSKSGTTLGTFSSAGLVRRGLQEAGFSIKKVPGLGKKREILAGVKN